MYRLHHIYASVAVLALLALSACGAEELQGPGVDGERARIVGGSTFTGMPAVGALTYNGGMHCTGTLVEPRKVLTAAHCVQGVVASRMRFVIGASLGSPQAVIGVSRVVAHPSYSSSSLRNDIGQVILSQDAPVAPMKVLTQSMGSAWVGRSLLFVGYGATSGYYGSGSGTKRAVWMNVASVSSTTFSYADSGRNTCSGDSGGPAFYQDASGEYLVAGVTSYGDAYCTQYGVDTRVDAYLSFLNIAAPQPTPQPQPQPAPSDPCGGETYTGRCDGNTVVWCENSQVYKQNCSDKGQTCQYSSSKKYYACGASPTPAPLPQPQPQPADPCQGETYTGRCQGNTVIWCENSQVKSLNCQTSYGRSCGWSSSKGYYGCI